MTAASLGREAGQAVWVGLPGLELDPRTRSLLAEDRVSGAILFKRNIQEPDQVAELNQTLHAASPLGGLFVAVDQEGGRVARLGPPLTVFPPMRHLGDQGNPALVRAAAKALASELQAIGFTVDFAPVVDVNTEEANPVIGDRAFGTTPERVSEMGATFIVAMQEAGMMACAKHFPGHGHTRVDSHLDLPWCDLSEEELRRDHLPPFAAAARVGVGAVMTAHVVYPAWDPSIPATLSAPLLTGILREELGFSGLILSDDLEMKAVAGRWSPRELVHQGILAGVDAFLVCKDQDLADEVITSLRALLEEDADIRQRFRASLARLEKARSRFCQGRGPLPKAARDRVLGPAAHPDLNSLWNPPGSLRT